MIDLEDMSKAGLHGPNSHTPLWRVLHW